jgi:hypothetical protein
MRALTGNLFLGIILDLCRAYGLQPYFLLLSLSALFRASVHTIEVSGDLAQADLQAWLDGRHAAVHGLHDKREAAKNFFNKLKVSRPRL